MIMPARPAARAAILIVTAVTNSSRRSPALASACVLALWLCSAGATLGLDPTKQISQYHSRTWSLEDGLPQSTVAAIAQTPDGYLWIGTLEGLVRFDGVRFTTVPGLPSGSVGSLAVDRDGVLWIESDSQVLRRKADGFEEVTFAGAPVVQAWALEPRRAGGIWIARNKLPLLFAVGTEAETVIDLAGSSLDSVVAMAEGPDQTVFATRDAVYSWRSGRFEPLGHREDLTPSAAQINALLVTRAGDLWIGTLGGGIVHCVEGTVVRRVHKEQGLLEGNILTLIEDGHGSVWLTDGTAGLARLHRGDLTRTDRFRTLHDLFEDRQGNLWLGSNAGGLTRLTDRPVTSYSTPEGLPIPTVHVVLETEDGTTWVGTEGGGLAAIEADGTMASFGLDEGLPGLDVMSLALDGSGRLLVGTEAGVVRREGGSFVAIPTVGSPHAFALHEDSSGVLWGGFLREIRRVTEGTFRPVPWGTDMYIAAIAETEDGTLWFGGTPGLIRYRQGQGETPPLGTGFVLALLADGDDLWVGTRSNGLGRWNAERGFAHFGTEAGLCDDDVFGLLDDGLGNLWMSSNRGIFSVRIDDALAVLSGTRSGLDCRLIGTSHGLRQREASGGTQPSAWRAHSNHLWFSTIEGVVRIEPEGLLAPRDPPAPIIEEVRSQGRSWHPSPVDGVRFDPEIRELEIDYTALELATPELLSFRYRLSGLDQAWIEAGSRRTAYYSHLTPGEFLFEVATRLEGGRWSPSTQLPVTLEPRFVETGLFRLLLLVLLGGGLAAAHRLRLGHLQRRQSELENAVAQRTAALEEAQAQLQSANQTLERRVEEGIAALRQVDRMAAYGHLVAGVAHELRHPLFAVQTAAHLLESKLATVDQVREEVDLLTQETERIELLLEDLLELARPSRPTLIPTDLASLLDEVVSSYDAGSGRETGITVVKKVEGFLPRVPAEREKLVRLLLNLLNNARIHAEASRLELHASLSRGDDQSTVLLAVIDDGVGISPTHQTDLFEPFVSGGGGTGLGLAIARRIAESHGGRIWFESAVHGGSAFFVELPCANEPAPDRPN